MGTKNNPGEFDCYTNAESDPHPTVPDRRPTVPDFTPEQIEWLSNLSAPDLAKELLKYLPPGTQLDETMTVEEIVAKLTLPDGTSLTLCEPPPPVIEMKVGDCVRLRVNDDGSRMIDDREREANNEKHPADGHARD